MIVRRLIPLTALLMSAGLLLAQQPGSKESPKKDTPAKKEPAKPAPGGLEDTLEKSLRNSADIKAAEAKVRDAEAELNRVRHQVLAKATALHNDLNQAKRMLRLAEDIVARLAEGVKRGTTTPEALLTAQTGVEKHRGEVEKLESDLKSLRGEFAIKSATVGSFAFTPDGTILYGSTESALLIDSKTGELGGISSWLVAGTAKAPAVQAPMMDRIKKLLEQQVELEIGGETMDKAMQFLLQAAKSDIPLRYLPPDQDVHIHPLKGKLSVGAWMQAIEDSNPSVRIVIRDYGLLLTTSDRVPDGALRVQDLWKGNYAELKKPEAKGTGKN
jgi:hypothetical protein